MNPCARTSDLLGKPDHTKGMPCNPCCQMAAKKQDTTTALLL